MKNTTSSEFLVEIAEYSSLTPINPSAVLPEVRSTAYISLRRKFIFIFVAQILALLTLASAHAFTLLTGTEVVLRTVPVDPWDMFRGAYVRIRYDISDLPCASPLAPGQQVFVVLRNNNGVWQGTRVEERHPVTGNGEVCVKATVDYTNQGRVRLRYGIEKYYVNEAAAADIERKHPLITVAVDAFGNTAIKHVSAQ